MKLKVVYIQPWVGGSSFEEYRFKKKKKNLRLISNRNYMAHIGVPI